MAHWGYTDIPHFHLQIQRKIASEAHMHYWLKTIQHLWLHRRPAAHKELLSIGLTIGKQCFFDHLGVGIMSTLDESLPRWRYHAHHVRSK
jgi:hypothetical protein